MYEGILIYDRELDRYDIRFSADEYYGGLHCGECFEVKLDKEWIPTRIELARDWYLVGIPRNIQLQGLTVRR